MVDIRTRRCSHDLCTKRPSFNVEGSKRAAYCKRHAEDGMVQVSAKKCMSVSCTIRPSFNFVGNKTASCCKQHALDGMVNVFAKRCSHAYCLKEPRWGVLADSEPTACIHHKGDILGGPVINFRRLCKVAGCNGLARWGIEDKQPTHCRHHGPRAGGLVCTVGKSRSKRSCRIPSYGAVKGLSFIVKPECFF